MATFGQKVIRRRDLRVGVILPLVGPLGLRGELVGRHLGDDARGALPRELVLFALQIGCVAQERHVRRKLGKRFETKQKKNTWYSKTIRKRFENDRNSLRRQAVGAIILKQLKCSCAFEALLYGPLGPLRIASLASRFGHRSAEWKSHTLKQFRSKWESCKLKFGIL